MNKRDLQEAIYDLRVIGVPSITFVVNNLNQMSRKELIVERGGDGLYFGHFTSYGTPICDRETGQWEDVELAEQTFEASAIGELVALADWNHGFEHGYVKRLY